MKAARLLTGLVLGAVTVGIIAAWGAREVRRELEREVVQFDLRDVLNEVGLGGRADSVGWNASRFRWFPRPALVLEGVHGRLYSGRPGPGRVSGRVRLRQVLLVPGLRVRPGSLLERVEFRDGRIEYGPDLLPAFPPRVQDPASGLSLPIPWGSLISFAGEPGRDARAFPAPPPSSITPSASPWDEPIGDPGQRRGPELRFFNIRLRALAASTAAEPSVVDLYVHPGDRGVAIRGHLEVAGDAHEPVVVPLVAGARPSTRSWGVRLGEPACGVSLLQVPASTIEGTRWRLDLVDPAGTVADQILAASLPDGNLRWNGPWRLEGEGVGPFPRGFARAVVTLQNVRLQDGASGPAVTIDGRAAVLPSRLDLRTIVVRTANGDTVQVAGEWLRTTEGDRLHGRCEGSVDLSWIGLLGEGWSSIGRLDLSVEVDGRILDGWWEVDARGSVTGQVDRLASPILSSSLADLRLDASLSGEGRRVWLDGTWGGSPFRLSMEEMPAFGSGFVTAGQGRWQFSSLDCRLDSFAASDRRRQGSPPIPVWVALPGRGEFRIERGSLWGIPVRRLHGVTQRDPSGIRLESLSGEVAQGSLRLYSAEESPVKGTQPDPASRRGATAPPGAPPAAGDSGVPRRLRAVDRSTPGSWVRYIEADGIDLEPVAAGLRQAGILPAGRIEGRLGGTGLLTWDPELDGGRWIGQLTARDGRVAGLALQGVLSRWTGIGALEELSFSTASAELRYGVEGVGWRFLTVDAPPVRLGGAGLWNEETGFDAVLSAAVLLEGGAGMERILGEVLRDAGAAVYLRVDGPAETPAVRLINASTFERERARLESKAGFP